MKRFLAFVVLIPLALCACEVNPATGQKDFTLLMPTGSEASVGAGEHAKIIKQYGVYDNPKVTAFVHNIMARLTPQSERKDISYRVTVLDDPMVNAFALPGGYLYITRGLIAHASNEAEVAAVLAHEMGHVTARHGAQQYSTGVLAQVGLAVLGAAVDAPGASDIAGIGANLGMSAYSREHEREADELGVRYLAGAGYNVYAMQSFMTTLKRQAALQAAVEGSENTAAASFFSTHPATEERIQNTGILAKAAAKSPNPTLGRDSYLRAVDGMVFGSNVKDGIFIGNTFVHNGINMYLEFPDGFSVKNGQSALTARHADSTTIVMRGGKVTKDTPLSVLNASVGKAYGQAIQTPETLSVNGIQGITSVYKVNNRMVRTVVAKWEPERAYALVMNTPQTSFTVQDRAFKNMAMHWRYLTNAEKQEVVPLKIRVITVSAGDTIDSLAARLPYKDRYNRQRFLTINGLEENASIQAGDRMKIIAAP